MLMSLERNFLLTDLTIGMGFPGDSYLVLFVILTLFGVISRAGETLQREKTQLCSHVTQKWRKYRQSVDSLLQKRRFWSR